MNYKEHKPGMCKNPLNFLMVMLLWPACAFAQSNKPDLAIGPIGALGNLSVSEKQIIRNSVQSEASKSYKLVSERDYLNAEEQAFRELSSDQCTEEQCIRKIQEILQVDRLLILQVIKEGDFTQITLTIARVSDRVVRADSCQGCSIAELSAQVSAVTRTVIAADFGGSEISNSPSQIGRKSEENLTAAPARSDTPTQFGIIQFRGLTPRHTVMTDGRQIEVDENSRFAVVAGSHKIKISKSGHEDLLKTIVVNNGDTFQVGAVLPYVWGILNVDGEPKGAIIEIRPISNDFSTIRKSIPLRRYSIPVGKYSLLITSPGYASALEIAEVNLNEVTRIKVKLSISKS